MGIEGHRNRAEILENHRVRPKHRALIMVWFSLRIRADPPSISDQVMAKRAKRLQGSDNGGKGGTGQLDFPRGSLASTEEIELLAGASASGAA
jgi:hypothetical protein